MDKLSQERVTMAVSVQPAAREMMRAVSEETGVSMSEMMTRYLEFLVSFDKAFVVSILHREPNLRRKLAIQAIEGMIENPTRDVADSSPTMPRMKADQAAAARQAIANAQKKD